VRLPGYAEPLLLLHGENDGSVPATETRLLAARLAEAQYQDYTVRLYPGLGHTLGPSTNLYSDVYAPITPDALREIGDWLDQRYRR
jgi:dipeptidyl aminopeptidase/acylaminoacyl peptidase